MTVTLPIESEDYDRVIRQLDGLAIGSAKWRDCGLVTVMDGPDVLNRLEDSEINMDDMDRIGFRGLQPLRLLPGGTDRHRFLEHVTNRARIRNDAKRRRYGSG